ncbi:hypothetical protein HMPREF1394_00219 [Helicobacter pylori GAM105Ai]|nr:hypothetical protein HMPREF1394_00219 [Helicobacter pylori GAM105Ai]
MSHPFKSGLVKDLLRNSPKVAKWEEIVASFGYFVKNCPTLITRLQQMGCKRA